MSVYDPKDQGTRRRRAKVSQTAIATRLGCSIGSLSEYESGKKPLPWSLTGADYEIALAEELVARGKREAVAQ